MGKYGFDDLLEVRAQSHMGARFDGKKARHVCGRAFENYSLINPFSRRMRSARSISVSLLGHSRQMNLRPSCSCVQKVRRSPSLMFISSRNLEGSTSRPVESILRAYFVSFIEITFSVRACKSKPYTHFTIRKEIYRINPA